MKKLLDLYKKIYGESNEYFIKSRIECAKVSGFKDIDISKAIRSSSDFEKHLPKVEGNILSKKR